MHTRTKITLLFTLVTFLLALLMYLLSIHYFTGNIEGYPQAMFFTIGFAGIIVLAFISGHILSGALLHPVKKIADEVKNISAQSLAKRIKTGTAKDEWNYLSETLNDLLNRLQESFDIQRRFISVASHELSTPLTSISSQLEVSLLRERTIDGYQQIMRSVYQDVRQLNNLTQTLLEFASVSGNSGGIELSPVRADEVLLQLPAEITKLNKQYSVKLEFEDLPENESDLLVFGNAALLFTAIKNLVMNACKYSDDKTANIHLSIKENNILIAIRDHGKGIPADELKNIFEPFYRTTDNAGVSGFGIGLALVNRIIKVHNGSISIDSIEGKGSTFLVQLPSAYGYKDQF
jgi:two-component system, OmpR family, sensor histidine kinase ArlS